MKNKIRMVSLVNNLWRLKMGLAKPIVLGLWITDKCNSHCVFCNIWKKGITDLNLSKFEEQLQKSKILKNINFFGITGGEPFLHKDVTKFVDVISKYTKPVQIRFGSNGFATDLITNKLKEICTNNKNIPINVKFSIDGMSETHNKLRGVMDGFSKTMRTIDNLKKLNFPNLSLSLSFTANSKNYKEIGDVLDIAEHKKIGFFYKPVMKAKVLESENISKDLFLTKEQLKYLKDKFHKRLFDFYDKKNFGERVVHKNYLRFLEQYYKNPARLFQCYACSASFHIDSNGNVYSCVQNKVIFGNIYKDKFDKIWKNQKTSKLRAVIKNSNCHCTCTGEMFPNILINKFPLGLI